MGRRRFRKRERFGCCAPTWKSSGLVTVGALSHEQPNRLGAWVSGFSVPISLLGFSGGDMTLTQQIDSYLARAEALIPVPLTAEKRAGLWDLFRELVLRVENAERRAEERR